MAPERHGRIERRDNADNWLPTLVEVTPVYAERLSPAHPRQLIGFKPLSEEDARQLGQLPGFPSDASPLPTSTPFPAVSPAKPESNGFPQAAPSSPLAPGRPAEQLKPHSTGFPVTEGADTLLHPVMQQKKAEGGETQKVDSSNVASIDDIISSASRPARTGSKDSRALQALKKKIDRGDGAFSDLPKTQDAANDLIRQILGAKNTVIRTTIRNGQTVEDIFDLGTGRGVRIIDGGFDTFVNLK
jgi:hypothetical protein